MKWGTKNKYPPAGQCSETRAASHAVFPM